MNAKSKSPPTRTSIVICWIALVATIACNGLFEYFRLGGVTSAEVSNQVFTWFMPAGYVFSIWGVIYAALIVWMIAETKRASRGVYMGRRDTALFVASCALNVGWLVAFHFQQIPASLVILVSLWIVLARLYVSLRDSGDRSRLNLAPFSLYFAWSTVAMIVNATNLASRLADAPLIVHQASTVVLGVTVLAVAYLSTRFSRDFVFPLVIIWALVGVGVHLVQTDALVASILFALVILGALAMYAPALVSRLSAARRSQAG